MLEEILEAYQDETFLKADGFDDAVIGVEPNTLRLIYSASKCIGILENDMPWEEAEEYFYFNVTPAYMGEKTPIFCIDYL